MHHHDLFLKLLALSGETHKFIHTVLAFTVGISYVMFTVGLILVVIRGHQKKGWGMPWLSVVALTAVSIVVLAGPTVQANINREDPGGKMDLFLKDPGLWYYLAWGGWLVPMFAVLYHFHLYSKNRVSMLVSVVVAVVGVWTYVVFYQDFYVNVISPIATFAMCLGYFLLLYRRPPPDEPMLPVALSVPAAWLFAVGTLLLYGATYLGGMKNAYPHHTEYDFVYFLYIVSLLLAFAYAYGLTASRRKMAAGEQG